MQSYNRIFKKTKGKFWKADAKDVTKLLIAGGVANAAFYAAGNFLKLTSDKDEDEEEFWFGFMKGLTGITMIQNSMPLAGNAISSGYDTLFGNANPWDHSELINPLDIVVDMIKVLAKGKPYEVLEHLLQFGAGINTRPFEPLWENIEKGEMMDSGDWATLFGFGSTSMPAEWGGYEWREISKGKNKGEVRKMKMSDKRKAQLERRKENATKYPERFTKKQLEKILGN